MMGDGGRWSSVREEFSVSVGDAVVNSDPLQRASLQRVGGQRGPRLGVLGAQSAWLVVSAMISAAQHSCCSLAGALGVWSSCSGEAEAVPTCSRSPQGSLMVSAAQDTVVTSPERSPGLGKQW